MKLAIIAFEPSVVMRLYPNRLPPGIQSVYFHSFSVPSPPRLTPEANVVDRSHLTRLFFYRDAVGIEDR